MESRTRPVDSFPMLQRCFQQQWNGLYDYEKDWVASAREPGHLLKEECRSRCTTLWAVAAVGPSPQNILLSIKEDDYYEEAVADYVMWAIYGADRDPACG